MSFLVPCPRCGPRDVYEFRYGGESLKRPSPDADEAAWNAYRYYRDNACGAQREWWFHKLGCRRWWQAERDTLGNRVLAAWAPGETRP